MEISTSKRKSEAALPSPNPLSHLKRARAPTTFMRSADGSLPASTPTQIVNTLDHSNPASNVKPCRAADATDQSNSVAETSSKQSPAPPLQYQTRNLLPSSSSSHLSAAVLDDDVAGKRKGKESSQDVLRRGLVSTSKRDDVRHVPNITMKTIVKSLEKSIKNVHFDNVESDLDCLCKLLAEASSNLLEAIPLNRIAPLLLHFTVRRNYQHQHIEPAIFLLVLRAITYICDALTNASATFVRFGVLPLLTDQLTTVCYIDIAEQSINALETISLENPIGCLRAGCFQAVFTHIDFYSTNIQKVAVTIARNICTDLSARELIYVMTSVPKLIVCLQHEDILLVEHASFCLRVIGETACDSCSDELDNFCSIQLFQQIKHMTAMPYVRRSTAFADLFGLLSSCAKASILARRSMLTLDIHESIRDALAEAATPISCSSLPLSPFKESPDKISVEKWLMKPHTDVSIQITQYVRALWACKLHRVIQLLDELLSSMSEGYELPPEEKYGNAMHKNGLHNFLQFAISLLPMVFQVYDSSGLFKTQTMCLEIIYKILLSGASNIIHNSNANISSFLAGVLLDDNPSTTTIAIKICEILMERLPSLYRKLFVKEGVTAAISLLAGIEKASTCLEAASLTERNEFGDEELHLAHPHIIGPIATPANLGITSSVRVASTSFRSATNVMPRITHQTNEGSHPDVLRSHAISIAHQFLQNNDFISSKSGETTMDKNFSMLKALCAELSRENIATASEKHLLTVAQKIAATFQLCDPVTNDGVSTFEFMESQVDVALLNYFFSPLSCDTFKDRTYSSSSQKRQVYKRFKNFIEPLLDSSSSEGLPLTMLIQKLQSALCKSKHFPDNEVPRPHSMENLQFEAALEKPLYARQVMNVQQLEVIKFEKTKAHLQGYHAVNQCEFEAMLTSHMIEHLLHIYLHGQKFGNLDSSNASFNTISLLRIFEALNKMTSKFDAQAWIFDAYPNNKMVAFHDLKTHNALVHQSEFLNAQLNSKVTLELQHLLSTNFEASLPQWCHELINYCPFLFPYETRLNFFYLTSFDLPREIKRIRSRKGILSGTFSSNSSKCEAHSLRKEKFQVSREHIHTFAIKIMNEHRPSNSKLEVAYIGEVGMGIGPTLEFYTLLSHIFQKRCLGMWRCHASNGISEVVLESNDEPTLELVHSPHGLFPRPMKSKNDAPHEINNDQILENFQLFGYFVAKSIQDGCLLDIPLSSSFYKLILGQELDMYDILDIDPQLGSCLYEMSFIAQQNLMASRYSRSSPPCLDYRGSNIDDLCLDFTLPGYPHFLLKTDGDQLQVNLQNLHEYVSHIVEATVKSGIAAQLKAFIYGYNQVLKVSSLQVFSENELEHLLCGSSELWSPKDLKDSIRFEHGYTESSEPIKNLLAIMEDMDYKEQRSFVQFVTGTPRLPLGGLAALSPRLTVVCKLHPAQNDECVTDVSFKARVDADLPSVMTCANYLKLPPYTSKDIMHEKLIYAITEGQSSFDLS